MPNPIEDALALIAEYTAKRDVHANRLVAAWDANDEAAAKLARRDVALAQDVVDGATDDWRKLWIAAGRPL